MNELWIVAFIIVPAIALGAAWGFVLISERQEKHHHGPAE